MDSTAKVETNIRATTLSPPPGYRGPNLVDIIVETKSDEILLNLTTGQRILTGRSTPVSPRVFVGFYLPSPSPDHIQVLLWNQLVNHRWLCEDLASHISTVATRLGFGPNGFCITVFVKITHYHTVVVTPPRPLPQTTNETEAVILRKVLLGRIRREEMESLEMEKESCSICLDDLCGGSSSKHGFSTRMDCSHVFHDRCLLEWLRRKNTCPLCRTVLYDQ